MYMVLCMKTTVDIADHLLASAKRQAVDEATTLRALIEEGLRRVLEERRRSGPFRLRRVTFNGNGLRPEVRNGSWERIRELIHEDSSG